MALLALSWPTAVNAAPDLGGLYYDQRIGARLPLDAPFVDDAGRRLTLAQVLGTAPSVFVLGYFHCPALCGIVRADLMQALAQAGLPTPGAYQLIAVSIDPAETVRDAAAAKAEDVSRYPTPGAASGWRFLTGSATSVVQLTRSMGFHDRFDSSLKQFIHPSGVVFTTPDGRISSYLLGLAYTGEDVRAGLKRASAGRLGRQASPILLLCLHYDAATGHYSLSILRLLRLFASVFIGAVVVLLIVANRSKPASIGP